MLQYYYVDCIKSLFDFHEANSTCQTNFHIDLKKIGNKSSCLETGVGNAVGRE